ncbi:unnamed protein product [Symbiodinium sp. CCMP2592]|nr:unnamed protein product [Symbiodinium sp. CCMP2592]
MPHGLPPCDEQHQLHARLHPKSHILASLSTHCTRKQLRLMDQGIKLREELSESKRKLAETDTLARLRAQNNEAMPNLLQRMGSESAFKGVPSDETDGTDG